IFSIFLFTSRRRHTRSKRDWSSDVCSSDLRHYYGKKPVETVDDLQGLSLRTQTSGVVSDYWQAVGAIPSGISWGELYQGLQQDVVDSSENAYPFFVQQAH